MKRLILILTLLTGIVRGQIVGGFLPLNSTKSFTAAGGRFTGNLYVAGTSTLTGNTLQTGSLTVGSAVTQSSLANFYVNKGTSTIAIGEQSSGYGAVWFNQSSINNNNYGFLGNSSSTYLNAGSNLYLAIAGTGRCNLTSAGLKVGAVTAPTATLDVTGTMSVSSTATLQNSSVLGSAVLTGGNTGTVAVLSDALFTIPFSQQNQSPADATTYYLYNVAYNSTATNAALGQQLLPYNCTLIGYSFSTILGGAGTAETSTLSVRANNSTDIQLSTSITMSTSVTFTASNLNTNFSAGDLINIKWVCPTWATNPTGVYTGLTLYFVRRQ